MTAILTSAATAFALALATAAAVVFLRRIPRPRALDTAALVVEGIIVIRAMIEVGEIVSGRHNASVTHIAYLLTSVAILPVAIGTLADDRSEWSSGVIAVASLALAVVSVRLAMTGGTHG